MVNIMVNKHIYGLPEKTEDWIHQYIKYLQSQIDIFENLIENALPAVSEQTKSDWATVVNATRYSRDLIAKRSHKLVKQENSVCV